jgi:hypothetical protein
MPVYEFFVFISCALMLVNVNSEVAPSAHGLCFVRHLQATTMDAIFWQENCQTGRNRDEVRFAVVECGSAYLGLVVDKLSLNAAARISGLSSTRRWDTLMATFVSGPAETKSL